MSKRFLTLALLLTSAVLATACGGSSKSTASGNSTVSTADTSVGTILVDRDGDTLYLFAKDSGGASSCTGACAKAWPPAAPSSAKLHAGSGAKASLLTTITRGGGTKQLSYNGHPLYTFSGDNKAGDLNGQGSNAFGANWYVVSPARVVHHEAGLAPARDGLLTADAAHGDPRAVARAVDRDGAHDEAPGAERRRPERAAQERHRDQPGGGPAHTRSRGKRRPFQAAQPLPAMRSMPRRTRRTPRPTGSSSAAPVTRAQPAEHVSVTVGRVESTTGQRAATRATAMDVAPRLGRPADRDRPVGSRARRARATRPGRARASRERRPRSSPPTATRGTPARRNVRSSRPSGPNRRMPSPPARRTSPRQSRAPAAGEASPDSSPFAPKVVSRRSARPQPGGDSTTAEVGADHPPTARIAPLPVTLTAGACP